MSTPSSPRAPGSSAWSRCWPSPWWRATSPAASPTHYDPAMTEHQPHVLALDDDAAVRDLIAEYLGQNEIRVTAVASGAELTAAMAQGVVDLVILDVRLPGEDGLQIARKLRE